MAVTEISPVKYGRLLAKALPKVIATREEFDRYVEMMEQLDRRAEAGNRLSPEEETLLEATWWESREGKRAATELMKRAAKSGHLTHRKAPLKTVSMRLPVADIEAAQEIAATKGLPYQTYIKTLLHEALQKERRSA